MVRKSLYGLLAFLLIAIIVFSACSSTTSSSSSTSQVTSTSKTSTTASATTQANWWDKWGTPQYGGEFVQCTSSLESQYDNLSYMGLQNALWFNVPFFEGDWTLDPSIYAIGSNFLPEKYAVGNSAESWEMTDEKTFVVHLKKGILFQNKAPVNGRELTAEDIAASMTRRMGPNSMFAGMMSSWDSVTTTDKYTVVFKFKNPCGGTAFQIIKDNVNAIESPEYAAMDDNDRQDWHNAVGAGPWMLTDVVAASSNTYSRNPTYFGKDPRFPENRIPYLDTLKIIVIADSQTQIAAVRTGKIDTLGSVEWQQAQALAESTSDLVKSDPALAGGSGIGIRIDKSPYTDIRVRKAMQMAIDRPTMAESLYGGNSDGIPCGLVSQAYTGWCYPYEEWPQSIKDEYAYNPTKAKELLTEAGYPDGFKTNVVQGMGVTPSAIALLEVFKAYFLDIGIDMEIKAMEGTAGENYLRSGKADQLAGAGGGMVFPPVRAIDLLYSKGSDSVFYGLNNFPDTVYDSLHDQFLAAKTEEEAAAIMVQVDKRVVEQHYGVWMHTAGTYTFTQQYIKGGNTKTGLDARRIWVDQSLKKSMGR